MDHDNDRRREDHNDIVRAGEEFSDGEDDADEWQQGDRNDAHEDDDDDEQNNDDDDDDEDDVDYAVKIQVLNQFILRNDPSLRFMTIGFDEYLPFYNFDECLEWSRYRDRRDDTKCEWERFGTQIGSHTHLKTMGISFEGATSSWQPFFRGLALNRSIKEMTIFDVSYEQFLWLIPFFVNNPAFENLSVCHKGGTDLGELIPAIGQFNSLKEFSLTCYEDTNIKCGDMLVKALASHNNLRKLDFSSTRGSNWRKGLFVITMLLENPLSKLAVLNLMNTGIDDEGARILSSGLNENCSLRELNLSRNNNITAGGWCDIFSALKNQHCKLEKLILSRNCMDKAATLSLKSAKIANSTVKSVVLNNMDCRCDFVGVLPEILRSPGCAIETLSLNSTFINVGDVQSLSEALAVNDRLRALGLSHQGRIAPEEWRHMFHYLQRPTCMVEELILRGNHINDDNITSLTIILSNTSRLRRLDLSDNRRVTSTGWMNFSEVLRSPNTMLERIILVENDDINNRVIVSIANALSDNNSLKHLMIGNDAQFQIEHAILITVLCNTSSILSTYNSNHTLEECTGTDYNHDPLAMDLKPLLKINKENSKNQAARIKIIKTHFSGSKMSMQVFTSMEFEVLPAAISWMGRDDESIDIIEHDYSTRTATVRRIGSGINILFAFLKSTPFLCEAKRNCKKRKATAKKYCRSTLHAVSLD